MLSPREVHMAVISGKMNVAQGLAAIATWESQGDWVPANGGTETPFLTRTGRKLLYCYQPRSGRHAYLDMGSDLILSDEEARIALGEKL
jgi:hypothetical protein